MKLVVLLAVVGSALSAPQAIDPDAETVITPGRRSPEGVGNGTIIIINPSFIDILRGLFGGGEGGGFVPDDRDPAAQPPQDSGRFPSLLDHPFFTDVFRVPFFGGSPDSPPVMTRFDGLPDNYDNSTHEVKVVNGSRVEVNRTITKKSGGNGVFITHVHTVRRLPVDAREDAGDDGGAQVPEADTLPEGNIFENRVDPSATDGVYELPSTRSRRWIIKWIRDAIKRSPANTNDYKHNTNAHDSHLNAFDLPSDKDAYTVSPKAEEEVETAEVGGISELADAAVRIPIRNNDDIAVNYIGAVPPPSDPDAEVIDFNLIREDERRFFESRSQPLRSQPMMSQPIRSQPMMSQPIMFQPIRSQPIRL